MKVKVPIIVDVHPETFSSGQIGQGPFTKNLFYEKYTDDRLYATQRPALGFSQDASSYNAGIRGRGIFYWERNDSLYFINNDTIYKNTYTNAVATISSGKDPVYIHEINDYIVFLDTENNEAWVLTSGDVLSKITDPVFPTTLAGGGAVMDTYLFVADNDGTIYHCDGNDPTSWNALNVLDAQRDPDSTVFLTKHYNNIVVIGTRTVEFFYNAANPTGSVLSRRDDVFYNIGCSSSISVNTLSDDIYFVGAEKEGSVAVYTISNFSLNKVSTPQIDQYLHYTGLNTAYNFLVAGTVANGHKIISITLSEDTVDNYSPAQTLVYDNFSKRWGTWATEAYENTEFPLVAWTQNTRSSTVPSGYGILTTGDIFRFRGSVTSTDVSIDEEARYIEETYIVDDYFESFVSGTSSNVEFVLRTYDFDAGVLNWKFMYFLHVVGGWSASGSGSDTISVRWTDDHYRNYSPYFTLDLQNTDKLSRLGRFKRRAFELMYTGSNKIKIESLEVNVEGSENE